MSKIFDMLGDIITIHLSSQMIFYLLYTSIVIPFFVGLLTLRTPPTLSKDFLSMLPVWGVGISFTNASILLVSIILENYVFIFEGPLWFKLGILNIKLSFLIDSLTCVMLLVITIISFLVIAYSNDYMAHDVNKHKFMGYLAIFTFSMMILVTAGNLIQMFVGWEGVGLLSFLLINFWNTRILANKSAAKAIIVNKIGDFFFLLGISALVYTFGTFDLFTILISGLQNDLYSLIAQNYIVIFTDVPINLDICCLFLLLAAFAKSAQIPFHIWLPDAMEGPSPVSALLHAATMVTAGVFIVCRFSTLFQHSPNTMWLCSIVGGFTAIFAASCGFFQNDIKRIIALSTCSQIGYMFFCCGLGGYNIAMFHLFNHAFFKAGLFLCAGAIIHSLNDEQDIRRMGALSTVLPFSTTCMVICSLSLAGFPFLSGYYSKDAILEFAYNSDSNIGMFVFILGILSAFFTALYSSRLIYLVFMTRPNTPRNILFQVHDAPIDMAVPILILTFFSIFVGYLFRDLFIGIGTDFWGILMPLYTSSSKIVFSDFVPYYIKILPTFAAFLGFILAVPFIKVLPQFIKTRVGYRIYLLLNSKWYFDHIISYFITLPVLRQGFNVFSYQIDQGIFIKVFAKGLSNSLNNIGYILSNLDKGHIKHNIITFGIGLLLSCYFSYIYIFPDSIFNVITNLTIVITLVNLQIIEKL
jgi:proton-translocating NADH-quinone oxidoreductase chain L